MRSETWHRPFRKIPIRVNKSRAKSSGSHAFEMNIPSDSFFTSQSRGRMFAPKKPSRRRYPERIHARLALSSRVVNRKHYSGFDFSWHYSTTSWNSKQRQTLSLIVKSPEVLRKSGVASAFSVRK